MPLTERPLSTPSTLLRRAMDILACGLLALLTSCSTGYRGAVLAETSHPVGTANLAMRVKTNLPFVTVHIAGRPLEFLVDTGASDSVITPETVAQLGLRTDAGTTPVRTSTGSVLRMPSAELPALSIGGLSFRKIPVLVHDCAIPRQVFPNLQGVLGMSLFHESLLTFDYPRRRLLISPRRALPLGHPLVFPMRLHLGIPQIPVTVGRAARRTWVDLDTGSNGTIELRDSALLGQLNGPILVGSVSLGLDGGYASLTSRLDGPLSIGQATIVNPMVEITKGDQRVGGEILGHFVVTVDFRSKLVAVSPRDVFSGLRR